MDTQHTVFTQQTDEQGKRADRLLLILMTTLIISVMNVAMFNVALPQIREQFSLNPSQVSWVMTSYSILYAIGTVIFGILSDRFQMKQLLTVGLLVFAVGSLTGMLATQFWGVIAGRILQAAGASVIPAVAMIIPVRYFPAERRGRALGYTATGLAIGNAASPIVGGLITEALHWRYLFALSLIVLLTLPLYRKYLKDEQQRPSPIDWVGALLLAATIASSLLAVTWDSLALGAVGLAALITLIVRINRTAHPFIQPALFKNSAYVVALVVSFLNIGTIMAIPFVVPQLLAGVNGLQAGMIGFVMFPGAVLSAILGRSIGRWADSKGTRFLMTISLSMLFVCFALLSTLVGAPPWVIAIVLISGLGGQLFAQIGLTNTISRTLPPVQTGIGMGFYSMNIFLSGAVSTVLLGKVMDYDNPGISLNPFRLYDTGLVYSNIAAALALVLIVISCLYYWRFGKTRVGKKES